MLLRFRVRNHRSLRDETELSLVSSRLRGSQPVDGGWLDSTVRVAGVYGPNASGKSNLLDAISFASAAIRSSATRWGDRSRFPYYPFRLDDESRRTPSSYEFDFVLEGVRHVYGFESTAEGIQSEWLYNYPFGRRRRLFTRSGPEWESLSFSRELPGENLRTARLTRPLALFLSVAANSNHPQLGLVHHELTGHLKHARFSDADRESRLRWVRDLLETPENLLQAQAILRFADVGIDEVRLHEKELDETFVEIFKRLNAGADGEDDDEAREARMRAALEEMKKSLRFGHGSRLGQSVFFEPEDESSGTLAWLSLGVPALQSLQQGDVFLVDELDASLHPRLSSALINMFKDSEINQTGAQLVFTSHDASLIGKYAHSALSEDEIWFCEKGADGHTDLYSLAEFRTRREDNFERRYLQGRYGAIPVVSLEDLREAVGVRVAASHEHA